MPSTFVKIHVWIRYKGQFPGQPAATNRTTVILQDPGKSILTAIRIIESCTNRTEKYAKSSSYWSIPNLEFAFALRPFAEKMLLGTLKKRLEALNIVSEDSEGVLSAFLRHQKYNLLDDIEKAHKIEFIVLSCGSLETRQDAASVHYAAIHK